MTCNRLSLGALVLALVASAAGVALTLKASLNERVSVVELAGPPAPALKALGHAAWGRS